MRELWLITKEPIKHNIVHDALKSKYKNCKINENQFFVGKSYNCVILWFDEQMMENEDKEACESWNPNILNKIPFEKPYANYIEHLDFEKVKDVINILYKFYPEMYIVDDMDNFYTVIDYLKTNNDILINEPINKYGDLK